VGRNTDYSQNYTPMGHVPMGTTEDWWCVNDPVYWKSTPVLQTTVCPDEDLSLLDPETCSDTPRVEHQLSTSGVYKVLQIHLGFA
jgi:hypothetical protein